MELGISSLAFIVEQGMIGKQKAMETLLQEATREALEFSRANGLKACELVLDPPELFRENQEFLEMTDGYDGSIQVHGPFVDLGMCSHNERISKASVESYLETAQICEEIGAEILTIHPGVANFLIPPIKTFNISRLVSAVHDLLDGTKGMDIKVCIENMPKNAGILLKTKDISRFFKKVDREDLYMTYDTSHLWTNDGNVKKLWNILSNRIKNVHIVENTNKDSDRHPPLGISGGKVEFQEIMDQIRRHQYDGALIIELTQASKLPQSIDHIRTFL